MTNFTENFNSDNQASYFNFKATQKELTDMSILLEGERYRAERLEGQINDLSELHQVNWFPNDILALAQTTDFLVYFQS
jgi:hypothetical protein